MLQNLKCSGILAFVFLKVPFLKFSWSSINVNYLYSQNDMVTIELKRREYDYIFFSQEKVKYHLYRKDKNNHVWKA
jgi:hypothetical protein